MPFDEADRQLAGVLLERRVLDVDTVHALALQAETTPRTFREVLLTSGRLTASVLESLTRNLAPPAPPPQAFAANPFSDPGAFGAIAPFTDSEPFPSEPFPSSGPFASTPPFNGQVSNPASERVIHPSTRLAQNPGLINSGLRPAANPQAWPPPILAAEEGSSESDLFGEETEQLPARFGPYELIEIVGSGGAGTVYKARSETFGRCAIKILHSRDKGSETRLKRFLAEARVLATLDEHPHIVRVLDSGQIAGRYYLAMELVKGTNFSRLIAADKVSPRAAARVVAKIASALSYAHSKGVVHRDLKPDNILIDKSSVPRLNDFGIAKDDARTTAYTMAGIVLGTLAYMAPEQAEDARKVDHRADIYGLGAVLYTALTKRPPHTGSSPCRVLLSLASNEPPRPRSIKADIDPVLEAICLKAIARDPEERYQNAEELRADLDAWRKKQFDSTDLMASQKQSRIAALPEDSTDRTRAPRVPTPEAMVPGSAVKAAPPQILDPDPISDELEAAPSPLPPERRPLDRTTILLSAILVFLLLVLIGLVIVIISGPGTAAK